MDESIETISSGTVDPIIREYAESIRSGHTTEVRHNMEGLSTDKAEFFRNRINELLKDPDWKKYTTTLKILLINLEDSI